MSFNEKIDKFMNEKNISNIKQLANNANIPYTTLRDFYEKKSADNSRLSTIRKLAKYMGCTMDYLAYDNIEDSNEVNINGFELKNEENRDDTSLKTKFTVEENPEKIEELIKFLQKNNFDYQIAKKDEYTQNLANEKETVSKKDIEELIKFANKIKEKIDK